MRKYFLLIIYIAGLVVTQQGLSAALPSVAFKMHGSNVTPLTVKTDNYVCNYDCYSESSFYQSGLNIEDDENVKSKLVYISVPSWLQMDTRFIFETDQLKYKYFFGPLFSFDLLKLIRVLRL